MAIVLNVFHVDILTCLEIILGEGKASDTVPLKDLLGGTGLTRELFDANAWFLESFGLIAIEPSKYKNAPTASVRLSITEMGSTALSVASGRRRHSLPRIWRALGDSFVSYLTDGESLYTGRGQRVPVRSSDPGIAQPSLGTRQEVCLLCWIKNQGGSQDVSGT